MYQFYVFFWFFFYFGKRKILFAELSNFTNSRQSLAQKKWRIQFCAEGCHDATVKKCHKEGAGVAFQSCCSFYSKVTVAPTIEAPLVIIFYSQKKQSTFVILRKKRPRNPPKRKKNAHSRWSSPRPKPRSE